MSQTLAAAERAETVTKRLLELEHDGRMTPEEVVEDARNPDSPLHEEFDWNDETAAHQQRLGRARHLIRMVVYEHLSETAVIRVPRYTHDPVAGKQQGYISVPQLLTEAERAARALTAELERAQSILMRAARFAAVLGSEADILALAETLQRLAARLTERAA